MADLVERDAGIAARLALRRIAVRVLRFRLVAEARRHEVLPRRTGHAGSLRIAILHPLLLRVVGGVTRRGDPDGRNAGYDQSAKRKPHSALLSNPTFSDYGSGAIGGQSRRSHHSGSRAASRRQGGCRRSGRRSKSRSVPGRRDRRKGGR